jgi:transcriptional regulator with XRE-family HTH domain
MHTRSAPRSGNLLRTFDPTSFTRTLGSELAAMRVRAGIAPEWMARQVDVSPEQLTAIEAGQAPVLTDLLVRWCAVVNADPGHALNRATHYTPRPVDLRVNLVLLRQGLPETGSRFKQLAAWTDAALGALPDDNPVVTLDSDDLNRLARDLCIPVADLVMTLDDFTPLEPIAHPD